MKKKFTPFFISISLFLIILAVFTYPLVSKIAKEAYGPIYRTDNRAAIRDFWFAKYAFLNNLDFNNNDFVNFPFGTTIKEYSLLPFWLAPRCFLSVLTNEIFSYNFLILGSFILSFLGMYLLSLYLTKNHFCAFIAGLIFSLCPYHFNKAWEHYSLTFIDFFPFSLLYLLKVKNNPNTRNFLLCAIFLVLVAISDLSYGYMIFIGVITYFFYNILYAIRKKEPFKQTLLFARNLIFVGIIALIIISPAIFPVIKQMFFSSKAESITQEVFIRPFKYLFTQSSRPLSYLMPAASHPIFGGFTKSMFGSFLYGRSAIEHTLYLGWLPILLAYFAFRKRKNKLIDLDSKQDFAMGFFSFLLLVSFLFSCPPYINLGIFKIYLPSFFMYKVIPMFRAYARFGILVMLSVSVLAAFGINFILNSISSKAKRVALVSIFALVILFEFVNIPPFRTTDFEKNTKEVYHWLAKQKDNFAIVEYPLGEGGSGESYFNLDYLLPQMVHQKKLINGAVPGTDAHKIKNKIRKITNLKTPEILKWLGAKYVIIHLNAYKGSEYREAMDVIGEVPDLRKSPGFKLVKEFNGIEVYEVTSKPIEPKL